MQTDNFKMNPYWTFRNGTLQETSQANELLAKDEWDMVKRCETCQKILKIKITKPFTTTTTPYKILGKGGNIFILCTRSNLHSRNRLLLSVPRSILTTQTGL